MHCISWELLALTTGMENENGYPNYPYPLKLVIWISLFAFVSNINTKWIYMNSFFNVFLYPIADPYSIISNSIRARKENKVS